MLFSFFLMVVFVIDISNILTFEPECDPPVALTLTDQVPLRSPISGCRFRPGKAISVEFIETFSRPKINRMLEADDHARSISAPAGLLRGLRNAVTPLHSPDRPHHRQSLPASLFPASTRQSVLRGRVDHGS